MIRVNAPAGIGLQHRGARLLDLEEQGILFAGHQEHYVAVRADTADTDHLDGEILDLIAVEEHPSIGLQRFPVAGKGG